MWMRILILAMALLPITFTYPMKCHSNSLDQEFFELGIVMTYAGLCAQKLNIQENSSEQQESKQLLNILLNRYGMQRVQNLEAVAVMGIQEFESDHGARCKKFLSIGKNLLNKFGLRGSLYERAFNALSRR